MQYIANACARPQVDVGLCCIGALGSGVRHGAFHTHDRPADGNEAAARKRNVAAASAAPERTDMNVEAFEETEP